MGNLNSMSSPPEPGDVRSVSDAILIDSDFNNVPNMWCVKRLPTRLSHVLSSAAALVVGIDNSELCALRCSLENTPAIKLYHLQFQRAPRLPRTQRGQHDTVVMAHLEFAIER